MIEEIIKLISQKNIDNNLIKKLENFEQKKLVYTSFDGDFMQFLMDMMEITMKRGYIPINPEATLGYYVSTTTHEGNKIPVMIDCIKTELMCDEMWIFNPLNNHIPEGVLAEMMVWKNEKKSDINLITIFDSVELIKEIKFNILHENDINQIINKHNKVDIESIKNKLILSNPENGLSHSYIVANFYNFKHIDWTRFYCYKNGICPISPHNILSYYLYRNIYGEKAKENYIIDRITLLNKADNLLFFTNMNNLYIEIENLDIYSCMELLYWYKYKDKSKIKIINWSDANVPKYKNSDKWAITNTEKKEVINYV
ncbi:hypothetical protein KHQ81_00690 [Mycoplasmatota bacterium]|nr:hypothetical protein KHQ81_00690 [Mycoplasmatota bacterium]